MNEHEQAYAGFQQALESKPDNEALLYNAGMAAYMSGRPDLSIVHWSRLKALAPTDWQVMCKLIQAFEAVGDIGKRDAERAELYRLRGGPGPDELKAAKRYCRDQFVEGGVRVMVFEFFDLEGDTPVRWSFDVMSADEKRVVERYSLGSYRATNDFARESGSLAAGQRRFHLDAYRQGGRHDAYGFFVGEPDYAAVKAMVQQVMRGERAPQTSSRPSAPA
jgi:hypothetical protein